MQMEASASLLHCAAASTALYSLAPTRSPCNPVPNVLLSATSPKGCYQIGLTIKTSSHALVVGKTWLVTWPAPQTYSLTLHVPVGAGEGGGGALAAGPVSKHVKLHLLPVMAVYRALDSTTPEEHW